MSFLYIVEKYASIRLDSSRLLIEKNELKTYVPIETVEGIVLIGNSNISSGCLEELLRRDLSVTFLSSTGSYYGRLDTTRHTNVIKQRQQFKMSENPIFCLELAKNIIRSKINNQIIILKRYNRNLGIHEIEKDITQIKACQNKVDIGTTPEQVMGYEGIAARHYFHALSYIIVPEFKFNGRNRMPPKDPFNSVLSLGYTLLFYEIYTAVQNKGLNPYAGFLHADRNNHPALISDLIEEWRAPIIDSLVINMFNGKIFKTEDFIKDQDKGAVYLTKEAIRKFIAGFEKRLTTKHDYLKHVDYKISYRKSLEVQVNEFMKALRQEDGNTYMPIHIR